MPPAADADDAGEGGVGPGEGALAVAEQLALEHVARDCRAIERDERAFGAIGGAMDGAREHFLAGAGFAGEENRQRSRGDAAADAQDFGGRGGGPDAFGVAVERLGGPQRGALLFLAAIAVEREGDRNQLADRDQRAAMFELGPRIDEEEQGLVAMGADRDQVVVGGWRAAAAASRSLQPCASITWRPAVFLATRATALMQPAAVSTAMASRARMSGCPPSSRSATAESRSGGGADS